MTLNAKPKQLRWKQMVSVLLFALIANIYTTALAGSYTIVFKGTTSYNANQQFSSLSRTKWISSGNEYLSSAKVTSGNIVQASGIENGLEFPRSGGSMLFTFSELGKVKISKVDITVNNLIDKSPSFKINGKLVTGTGTVADQNITSTDFSSEQIIEQLSIEYTSGRINDKKIYVKSLTIYWNDAPQVQTTPPSIFPEYTDVFGQVQVVINHENDQTPRFYKVDQGQESSYTNPFTLSGNTGESKTVIAWAQNNSELTSDTVSRKFNFIGVNKPTISDIDTLNTQGYIILNLQANSTPNPGDSQKLQYRVYMAEKAEDPTWHEYNGTATNINLSEGYGLYNIDAQHVINNVVSETQTIQVNYVPTITVAELYTNPHLETWCELSNYPNMHIEKMLHENLYLVRSDNSYVESGREPAIGQELGDLDWANFKQNYWFLAPGHQQLTTQSVTTEEKVRTYVDSNTQLIFAEGTAFESAEAYIPNQYQAINFGTSQQQDGKFYVKPKPNEWLKVKDVYLVQNEGQYAITNQVAPTETTAAPSEQAIITIPLNFIGSAPETLNEALGNRIILEGVNSSIHPFTITYLSHELISSTGITDAGEDKTLVRKVYISPTGLTSTEPHEGINIVQEYFKDGAINITKKKF